MTVEEELKLLLVDDENADRALLRRALRKAQVHWELTEVGTAAEARRVARGSSFDCALLDLRLPDGDGIQLIEHMGRTPAIILTGLHDTASAERALQHGAQDYLVKGEFDGEALKRAVRYAIERKQGELLRTQLHHAERLASLGGLAASVAHEVNNPASFVMANLLALREQVSNLAPALRTLRESAPASLPQEVRDALGSKGLLSIDTESLEMLDESIEGMRRITSIVRQMQTFSRSEQLEEPVAPVSLNKVAEWACLLTWPQVRHRAHLEKNLASDLPLVPGHQARLSQVVTNLLVNAAQAIDEGSPEDNFVRIRTLATADGVELHVEDSGNGIPEALKRRVLEPFFTTKPVGEGTGLGLSVSTEILRAHQGELHLEDRAPRGTLVRMVLPRNTGLVPTMPLAKLTPFRELRSLRILLIDDEPAVGRAYRRLLRGHEVVTGDVHDALRALTDGDRFDAVLCDIMMPDIDGPGFYDIVSQRFPELVDKLVFLTGGVFTDRVRSFVDRVSNRVLAKPATRDSLLDALEQVHRGAQSHPVTDGPVVHHS